MKAIILAAGVGSRLHPITEQKPKTLVTLNNIPLLHRLLVNLTENDIHNIVICTGYLNTHIEEYVAQHFPNINITYVHNADYATTNNMYSLYLAKEHFTDDLLIMNADIVFDKEIITKLIAVEGNAVAVDRDNYIEEAMKITVDEMYITGISKKILPEDAYGSSIDLYKISQENAPLLVEEMINIIETQNEKNQWTEVMLNSLFNNQKLQAVPCDIESNKWYEIDTVEDLVNAEEVFNADIKTLSDKKIFFLDRDGTLALGKTRIDSAIPFLEALKESDKHIYMITNNSSKTTEQYETFLKSIGLPLTQEQILTSLEPTIAYFKENNITNIFWIANEKIASLLEAQGFTLSETPDVVLITFEIDTPREKLDRAAKLVTEGIPYYATHTDMVCPTEDGDIPDVGTYIAYIEEKTGTGPTKTFGKPDLALIEQTLKKHNATLQDAVIIGDRLYTDIVMAKNNNLTSILVLTGETKRHDYEASAIHADIIVENLKKLIPHI